MKESKKALSALVKTTQMGQVGIRCALEAVMTPNLRKALESQLREYDALETQAHAMASCRGWELPSLDPAWAALARMTTRLRLNGRDNDSKVADMMIQGNTRGMIQSLRHLHRLTTADPSLGALTQRVLDFETANIRQMQPFL